MRKLNIESQIRAKYEVNDEYKYSFLSTTAHSSVTILHDSLCAVNLRPCTIVIFKVFNYFINTDVLI